jgi:hypothetical protein
VLEVIPEGGSVRIVGRNRNSEGTWKGTQEGQKFTEDGSWKLESRNRVDLA